MIGAKYFLVKQKSSFEDEVVIGDKKIYLSSVYKDAFDLKSVAEVIALPHEESGLDIQIGDTIVTSYLIFMEDDNVMAKRKEPSPWLVDATECIYAVPKEMIYAYIRDGKYHLPSPFIFVEPIKYESKITDSGIEIVNNDPIQQFGRVVVGNSKLKEEVGVDEGDVIVFLKYSEYEVNVFGEKFYRMQNDWIMAKYEE